MLYDDLRHYAGSGVYPMHMPGHKRNAGLLSHLFPYDVDITEIHGFDDLHDPHGVLLELSRLAASLYGSAEAFPLVNGSTVGILAAIGAHAKRGDKLLFPTNCHRSVTNAASLFGLVPVYITPEADAATGIPCSITLASVEAALASDCGISLVVITSPTYEGVVSDVKSIAGVAHDYGVPLLVDSAHGAHLGFSDRFPRSAIDNGADVVVMSLHKTLPALTQCSLLHVCGERANAPEIKRLLSCLQTSSPSYVLMSSMDHCLRLLASDGDKLFSDYIVRLERFSEDIMKLGKPYVLCHGKDLPHPGFFDFDRGKLVIITQGSKISGFELADVLRAKYKIELEIAHPGCAVAMTSICDTDAGFSRLASALFDIEKSLL